MTHFQNVPELLVSSMPSGILKQRIKRELEDLIKNNTYDFELTCLIAPTNYTLAIYNRSINTKFEFTICNTYPFTPPKLVINGKPYESYLYIQSELFGQGLKKYKNKTCFCCESILCPENWVITRTLKYIMDEFIYYKNICQEISHIGITNVIKRKYLNENINLIEWLH